MGDREDLPLTAAEFLVTVTGDIVIEVGFCVEQKKSFWIVEVSSRFD